MPTIWNCYWTRFLRSAFQVNVTSEKGSASEYIYLPFFILNNVLLFDCLWFSKADQIGIKLSAFLFTSIPKKKAINRTKGALHINDTVKWTLSRIDWTFTCRSIILNAWISWQSSIRSSKLICLLAAGKKSQFACTSLEEVAIIRLEGRIFNLSGIMMHHQMGDYFRENGVDNGIMWEWWSAQCTADRSFVENVTSLCAVRWRGPSYYLWVSSSGRKTVAMTEWMRNPIWETIVYSALQTPSRLSTTTPSL